MFDGGATTLPRPAAPEPRRRSQPQPRRAKAKAKATPPPRRPSARRANRGNPFRRLRSVFVLFAVLFLVVAGRLAQLQVVDRSKLEALGEEQRTRSIEVPADR